MCPSPPTIFVTVSDQGPGIALGERERATDRFYRGESARSTPGSGLGLSLVLAVAHLHGGELRLEDNRPGLRAILGLPLPEDEEGSGLRSKPRQGPAALPPPQKASLGIRSINGIKGAVGPFAGVGRARPFLA